MNSKAFQIFIALSIPIIVIISVLLLISFEKKKTTENPESSFPYQVWAKSPKSCIGNMYSVQIEIQSQLAIIDDNENTGIVVLANASEGPLPIFIPRNLNTNVHPKQKFNATLSVANNGALEAKSLNKF